THAYTLRGPSTKECPKTTPGTRYPHRSVLDTALPVLNSVARHIEHEPGQELYVDWAGDKVSIIDKATGDVGMKASLFVAICPYS
ncbi:hypothetical protein ACOJAZ_14100, partial [Corynebacterium striatum]